MKNLSTKGFVLWSNSHKKTETKFGDLIDIVALWHCHKWNMPDIKNLP